MNSWKKGIISLLLACLCVPVAATEPEAPQPAQLTAGEATPQGEQTEWYHRNLDGKWQKRLWSITECRWLTDWIDC